MSVGDSSAEAPLFLQRVLGAKISLVHVTKELLVIDL